MLTPHPFQCRGNERVELYLYSPYGPYGLYRASVPVQGCILPLPLPFGYEHLSAAFLLSGDKIQGLISGDKIQGLLTATFSRAYPYSKQY